MEELYYINGKKESYTLKQLLCWCYCRINQLDARYDRTKNKYYYCIKSFYKENSTYNVNSFFKQFAHNNNDDNYWVDGYLKKVFHKEYQQQKDELGNLTSEWLMVEVFDYYEWVKPYLKEVSKSYYLTDQYNRVINSGFLKQEYLKYKFNLSDKKPYKRSYRFRNSYEFRKGPVPNIRSYRNKCWHKYRGNHGHTIQELRSYYSDILYKKEIKDEYGITFKIGRSWYELDPWNHGHHSGTHGKNWKRTRKEKQWMKFGWKRSYKEVNNTID